MKSEESNMALNSMFFEKTLGEAGRIIEAISKDGEESEQNKRELAYQEGKVFLCFQIYRQNIHNPRLLEISEKRISDIKDIRDAWDKEREESKDENSNTVGDENTEKESQKVDKLTEEKIKSMKSDELKKEVVKRNIVLEKYTVEPMREALMEIVNEEG